MALITGNRTGVNVRQVFGYGAAATMLPYLTIKVCWVIGALFGFLPAYAGMGLVPFVVLNLMTIVLASAAVGLALALVRPWGERVPTVPLLVAAWVGAGFLIPMLPYMVLTSVMHEKGAGGGLPGWESSLIEASFIGWALGFAVALPFYLRSRWPSAFNRRGTAAPGLALAAAALGAVNLYWALGGTTGIAEPALRALDWRLMTANTALWAFAGAWGVWRTGRGWLPMTVTWVASGFLFAWSAWKLPFTLFLTWSAPVWPENLGVAAAVYTLSVAVGLLMVRRVVPFHGDATSRV